MNSGLHICNRILTGEACRFDRRLFRGSGSERGRRGRVGRGGRVDGEGGGGGCGGGGGRDPGTWGGGARLCMRTQLRASYVYTTCGTYVHATYTCQRRLFMRIELFLCHNTQHNTFI